MTVRIGVEEEFHIVEVETGLLAPRADTMLETLPADTFTTELQQATVETNSGVHESLAGLYDDVVAARRRLDAAASAHGLAVVAAGTVPLARPQDTRPTAGRRYRHMVDEYRMVADEQLICGTHVHVDVPDRDLAVRVMCEVAPWLHVLLALSASSPSGRAPTPATPAGGPWCGSAGPPRARRDATPTPPSTTRPCGA